jgi:hypothetical protein
MIGSAEEPNLQIKSKTIPDKYQLSRNYGNNLGQHLDLENINIAT